MNITTHANGFQVSAELEEFIEKKVEKLQTYMDKIISVDVYLKFENHSQIKDKTTDVKVNIPGSTLFASETAKTFEEGVDEALESLRRQIRKHKTKEKNR